MLHTESRQESERSVFKNARALLLIQIANQFLPLLLVPYLAHTLGAELYGLVAFGTSIVAIATVLTDYGFNLSVTLEIAKRRQHRVFVNRLIGAVMLSKTALVCIATTGIAIYALTSEKYAEHFIFILLLILPTAVQAFQPVWLFQGIEKMGYIAVFTLFSRVVQIAMIFIFIKSPQDYTSVVLINAAAALIGLALAFGFLCREGYRPTWPGYKYSLLIVRRSTTFFWSRAAVSTYTAGGTIFLGLFSTPVQVAYYAAAEQIYKGVQGLYAPLSQALYPNLVRTKNFALLARVIKFSTLSCMVGAVIGVFAGEAVIGMLFGSEFHGAYAVLRVFLLTLLINTPSVLLGYPMLGALGQANLANRSVMYAGIVQFLLLGIFASVGWTEALHTALSVLFVEAMVLLMRVYWANKCHAVWKADLVEKKL